MCKRLENAGNKEQSKYKLWASDGTQRQHPIIVTRECGKLIII